ncbi:hypothetical protein ACFPRL_01380 [Pseudoclavibacter helvolus]
MGASTSSPRPLRRATAPAHTTSRRLSPTSSSATSHPPHPGTFVSRRQRKSHTARCKPPRSVAATSTSSSSAGTPLFLQLPW